MLHGSAIRCMTNHPQAMPLNQTRGFVAAATVSMIRQPVFIPALQRYPQAMTKISTATATVHTVPSMTRRPIARAVLALGVMSALAGTALAQEAARAPGSAASAPLLTLKDKMSYSTGVMTARQLTKNEVPFDVELIIQGLRDGLAGGDIRITEKELKIVLQSMSADIAKKMSNERQVKASINRERGVIFQNEFKTKPGVTVLPGNLMYRVVKEGNGDKPSELGTVVVKYRGTLVDGTEFDATPEGKTATIKLTDVITGWKETLKRMPAGSTWEVVVPTSMAYSTRGTGNIGPNETLVFTIELVAVVQ
jgi:FKBP-type peptidyl-prolyl cis-trans isomerase FklB